MRSPIYKERILNGCSYLTSPEIGNQILTVSGTASIGRGTHPSIAMVIIPNGYRLSSSNKLPRFTRLAIPHNRSWNAFDDQMNEIIIAEANHFETLIVVPDNTRNVVIEYQRPTISNYLKGISSNIISLP